MAFLETSISNKVGSIQLDTIKEHSHDSGNLKNSESELRLSGFASPDNRVNSFSTSPSGEHYHSFRDGFFSESNGDTGPNNHYGTHTEGDYDNKSHTRGATTDFGGNHSHTFSLPNYSLFFSQKKSLPQIISGSTTIQETMKPALKMLM